MDMATTIAADNSTMMLNAVLPAPTFAQRAVHQCSPSPDMEEAARFLKMLDPTATEFTFQTFDDKKTARRHLIKVLHGTLEQHRDELCRLNAQGAGIFVTINETDGAGRKKENIVSCRAVWADLDGAPLEPVMACFPHMADETSPGKYHALWLVEPSDPVQGEQINKQIAAKFGADPNATDYARVLRLPGFLHQKSEPFMVRIIESLEDEPRWTLEDVSRLLDLPPLPASDAAAGEILLASPDSPVSPTSHADTGHLGLLCKQDEEMVAEIAASHESDWENLPNSCRPDRTGMRNQFYGWNLTRHRKSRWPNSKPEMHLEFVRRWFAEYRHLFKADWREVWSDFLYGWNRIKFLEGEGALRQAFEETQMNKKPIPEILERIGYDEGMFQIVRICELLAMQTPDRQFFLGCRPLGDLVGISHTSAAKILSVIASHGIIELLEKGRLVKGSKPQATTYRFKGVPNA